MIRKPTPLHLGTAVGALILTVLIAAGVHYQPTTTTRPPTQPTPTPKTTSRAPESTPVTPTPTPSPTPTARAAMPVLRPGTWMSWALLDLDTARQGGSPGTSTTDSMIKVGIAADVLRALEAEERDPSPHQADLLGRMIRDSDNAAADELYAARGGAAVIARLVTMCGLTQTRAAGHWGNTVITAGDAAKLGLCVGQGRVCGPGWVTWLRGRMGEVRGLGKFGLVTVRPVDNELPLSYKNGWTIRPDGWHVSCLVISDWWSLAVLTRYPLGYGMAYGGELCAQVGAAVAPADTQKVPATTR